MAFDNIIDIGAVENGQPVRKPWTSPDLIFSDIATSTEKLSSTVEFFVPEFNRTLGPS
jgi:hypothetical protein